MRTFTYTEHIDRAPADVFADFSQASRWRNLVRRMEIVGGGPVREGWRNCRDVRHHRQDASNRLDAVGLRSATSVRSAEYRIRRDGDLRVHAAAGRHRDHGDVFRCRPAARPHVADLSVAPPGSPLPVSRSAQQPQTRNRGTTARWLRFCYRASEHGERATRPERAGEAASEGACRESEGRSPSED